MHTTATSDSEITRRSFVGRCCAGVGAVGMISTLAQLRLIGATADSTTPQAPVTGRTDDYRALVCLFLAGGNDANNLIIPTDAPSYAAYAKGRGALALPSESLLGLAPRTTDGRTFGLHPAMPELRDLFAGGKLAVLANVGTLAAPTTKAQFKEKSVPLPNALFSHNDQQVQWQSSLPDSKLFTSGWGGRLADLTDALNRDHTISMSISLAGQNSFQVGKHVTQYAVSPNGAIQPNGGGGNLGLLRAKARRELLEPADANLFATAFAGLTPDPSVKITRQVLAEPDSDLPGKVWASLADGTPLVTAKKDGKGLIVLFHVTANADWSNLPVTGLFVDMLRRMLDLAPAAGSGAKTGAAAPDAQAFAPFLALNGFGDFESPAPDIQPIPAAAIDKATATATTPPGLYRRGEQERSINITRSGNLLTPIGDLPTGVTSRALAPLPAIPLAPYAFILATLLFLLDCLASLYLGGGLTRLRQRRAATVGLFALALIATWQPLPVHAQTADDFAMQNALETHIAYVKTGDDTIDGISDAGLKGLGEMLRERTSVNVGDPVGVNIERDELVFFPLLYWPVRPDAAVPSDAALARIDAYMKGGGTIFFDLRDDGASADSLSGGATASSEALRRILSKLDIPPLEPVPPTHVLTKSFYLLDHFPGRYDGGKLWVERPDSEGASTGNTDGVSGIIIGSNDYAAAWAMDANGDPTYAVVPGTDRQREFAFRTGINVVMYALTGNYKADQVHVRDLLERLAH